MCDKKEKDFSPVEWLEKSAITIPQFVEERKYPTRKRWEAMMRRLKEMDEKDKLEKESQLLSPSV